jgi:hypothetical protein
MTAVDGVDAAPVPAAFSAVTVKVYATPFVRPETTHWSGPLDHKHCAPPGDAVTV